MTPDDIRIKVSEETEKQVIEWVCKQIDTALQDRISLETRWEKWIKHYEEILPEEKIFPWPKCSNLSIPITPIAVETIHAREVNTLLNIRPYIQIRAKKKHVNKNNCVSIEKFLDQVFALVIDFYNNGSQWLLEKNKMGTGFIKIIWNYDRKKVKSGSGKDYEFKEIDDAKLYVIPIEDIIFPSNASNIQDCLFLAHRIRTSWSNLKKREKQKIYENIENIKQFVLGTTEETPTGKDIQKIKEDAEKIRRTQQEILGEYEIFEVWFDYDIDDDGYAESTVMTIHKDSKTKLRWIHAPYNHGKRPIIDNHYIKRVNRVNGKGICEISEHIQNAVNTVFNQTIDNATIANIKCFKGRKTARKDIGKIYPGKVFWLDDPTDLEEFMLGEVHQSSFLIHNLLRDYHERRTKVTDYTLGRESTSMGSRATATGTLALLQESGRHFDLIINNSRNAMVELAYQIVELYLQYRPEKIFETTGDKDVIEQITLPTNINNLREEYEFYCTATSLTVNKEIEKQTNLLLLQQLGGIFQQMLNMLMLIHSPQMQLPDEVKQFIVGIIKSYYTMAEDLIRSFEKIDIESYLPELPAIVQQAFGQGNKMQDFLKMLGGLIGEGGGQANTQGPAGIPGMETTGGGMQQPEGQGIQLPIRPSTPAGQS